MKSWGAANPAKKLSVDLNKVDVSATGFWWCLACHRITEPLKQGEYDQQCTHCHSFRIVWKAPVGSVNGAKGSRGEKAMQEFNERAAVVVAGTRVEFTEEALAKKARLPAEKRNLRVLASTGYYFCFDCLEVTELAREKAEDGAERCVLCSGKDVRWQNGLEQAIALETQSKEPNDNRDVGVGSSGVAVPGVGAVRDCEGVVRVGAYSGPGFGR